MLLRKHQIIALVSGTLSVLALTNCSDSDTVPDAGGGSSGSGKAGASVQGGSAGKGGSSNPQGGNAHAGSPNETGGDSAEAGGAGKPSAGSSGTGNPGGGNNTGDAGTAGAEDDGGAAGAGGGHTGPHVGAILKYAFDEGSGLLAADSSGSGLDGTLAIATAWTAQGRTGAGLALTGGLLPTAYLSVPAGLFTDVKSTTIAAWVKLTADVPWNRIFDFGGKGVGTDTRFMYLTTNTPDGMRFSTYGGVDTREATVTTKTLLPLGVWKHVAVTAAEGGKRAIYIDGFPAAEATTVDVPPSELEPMSTDSWLGKSRFPTDAGLNGVLDDFTVYDRVLSASEIAALAFPKADYTRIPFDEAAGTTSADVSTRAVNASLTGATWASGRLGAAVQLSGASQYVTLANPIAGCTDSLTIALWVKEAAAANWARVFDFGGTTDNFMFLTPNNADGKLQLSIHITGVETKLISATTLPADATWHHLAVVVSPAAATVFIDGASVGTSLLPVTPAVLGATNEHWLGKSRFDDPYFNGSFDEVRISCRAFTPDEIKNLAFH
jgi:hypothetical protein